MTRPNAVERLEIRKGSPQWVFSFRCDTCWLRRNRYRHWPAVLMTKSHAKYLNKNFLAWPATLLSS